MGQLRTKANFMVVTAPEILQYQRQTPGRARDYGFLRKKQGQNLLNWEMTCTSLEKTYPQKRCERVPESLARMIGEGLPL